MPVYSLRLKLGLFSNIHAKKWRRFQWEETSRKHEVQSTYTHHTVCDSVDQMQVVMNITGWP